nr:unnamed protein product [Spirometra erinaceieuropaei]
MSSTYKHEENADHLANDPPKGLVGLQNLGNTCFMNASLQVLSQCPPLTDLLLCPSPFFRAEPPKLATAYRNLLSEIWSATRPRVAVPNSVLNAIRAVHPMFRGFAQHDSPEFIRAFLNDLHEELKVTTEEDLSPEDGKRHLIHGSYPNGEAGGKPATKSSHSSLLPKDREAGDTKQQPVNLPQPARSPITDIFQGKMMTSVKCLSCGQVSNRQEVFLDLSLPITGRRPINSLARVQHSPCARNVSLRWPTFLQRSSPPTPASPSKSRTRGRSANSSSWSLVGATQPLRGAVAVGRHVISPLARGSVALFATLLFYLLFALSWLQSFVWSPTVQLDDCLAAFFAEDELSGENQYYCSRCAKLSNGLMHSELIRLPEVLCLHLKRFRNDSHSLSKISSSVTFPLHRLDLSSYLHPSCSDKVTTYDLMGVICHTGGVTFGHYYGYALNRYTHSWYEFDDAIVSPVDESEVAALSSRAYVLVYRKQDDNIAPLRIQVDSLATEYSLSPSKADSVWVDRRWLTRFSTFSDPGPVNNEDFLCSHGYFKPILWEHRDDYVCQIPVKIWNLLIER